MIMNIFNENENERSRDVKMNENEAWTFGKIQFCYMWMAKDIVWLEKSIGIGTENKKVLTGSPQQPQKW